MRNEQAVRLLFVLVVGLALANPVFAQSEPAQQPAPQEQQEEPAAAPAGQPAAMQTRTVPAGQTQDVEGIIVQRNPDSMVIRNERGADYLVLLTNDTEVKERKKNPFRGARKYAITQLVRGLEVEVEGRGDSSGALVAEAIKFKHDDFRVAQTVESRVNPVEGRVESAEFRLKESETNARRMSGQIEELNAISAAIRGETRTAQQSAETAIAGVRSTNERITAIDDYEAIQNVAVLFKAGSARLSPEAREMLDQLVSQTKDLSGYMIEVAGFASADGPAELNRRLSERRTDAVIRYLAEEHDVPLRRIIQPFGYGEAKPVADNSTREGRRENRRVEVNILVSRGLVQPGEAMQPPEPPAGSGESAARSSLD